MTKYRILMLNNEYPPLGGGTATINKLVLEALAKTTSLECTLITSSIEHEPRLEDIANGSQIIRLPVGTKNIHHASNLSLVRFAFKGFFKAASLVKKNQFSLVFAWSAVPSGFIAFLLKKFFKVPYIVRVVGPDIPGFEERYRWLYPILRPIIHSVWRNARDVVVKCEHERKMVESQLPGISTTTIHNGIDLKDFTPKDPSSKKEFIILCVSRLIARKGIDVLFKALQSIISHHSDIVLRLVGTGDEEASLRQLAKELAIDNNVQFVGYVPRESIKTEYSNASIFVLPSKNEGMSVSTLEALASGLPCLVTKGKGFEELVTDGENGFLLKEDDINQFADKILYLYQNPNVRKKMSQDSKTRSLMFNTENMIRKFEKLILEHARTVKDS